MGLHPKLSRILEAAKYIPLGGAEESAICLNALGGPAITRCSHVFYRNYIQAVITCEGNATPGLCASEWSLVKVWRTSSHPTKPVRAETNLVIGAQDWGIPHGAKTLALRDQLLGVGASTTSDKIVSLVSVKILGVMRRR